MVAGGGGGVRPASVHIFGCATFSQNFPEIFSSNSTQLFSTISHRAHWFLGAKQNFLPKLHIFKDFYLFFYPMRYLKKYFPNHPKIFFPYSLPYRDDLVRFWVSEGLRGLKTYGICFSDFISLHRTFDS